MLKAMKQLALLLALAYVAVCGFVFAALHQPPSVLARYIDRVPRLVMAVVPLPAMWTWVNRGDLEPGDPAPDFELYTLDRTARVRLSALRGSPVVLYFGSYTCPPFRKRMPEMNKLYEAHKHQARFYFVYVEEAHSSDGWRMADNTRDKVLVPRHRQLEERIRAGAVCQEMMKIAFPILVDEMDNRVETAYRAWPIRVYVIDEAGRVAFKSDTGPYGFEAEPVREAFERLLGPPAAAAAARRPSPPVS